MRSLATQFQLLRALTQTKRHKMSLISTTSYQTKKNRYPQQTICNFLNELDQYSRVRLNNVQKENQNGYVNANLIYNQGDKKVWITQGPTDNTVKDFYALIKQEQVDCVVMLCKLVENGKSRCANYLQNVQKSVQFKKSYLTQSTISLPKTTFQHIQYSQWPDRSVPDQISHIFQLVQSILPYSKILIHCSAGLGRSGVIAAVLIILFGQRWRVNKEIEIFQAVRNIRQRRFGAIQNQQQYQFVYNFFEYLKGKQDL